MEQFIIMLLLAIFIFSTPVFVLIFSYAIYLHVRAAITLECIICGKRQNSFNVSKCPDCKEYFCTYSSPLRHRFAEFSGKVLLGYTLFLTAFTIVGGIIIIVPVILALGIPWLIMWLLLPGDSAPPTSYFSNHCYGAYGRCVDCGEEMRRTQGPPSAYSMTTSSYNFSDSMTSSDSSDNNNAPQSNREPSFWDGWLFKYGPEKDEED